MNMKCMIDVQPLLGPKSGVAYYTSGLLDGLAQIGCDEEIVLSYFDFKRKGLHLADQYKCFKNCSVRLPGRAFSFLWKYINFPSYSMVFGKSDLYHFPNFIIRPISCGKRVVTIHDVSFLRLPQFTEPKNLKYLKRKIGETIECVDRIIVVSEFTKKELLAHYPDANGRVDVIYQGVQKNRFHQDSRFRLNLPDHYMLYVGKIEPRKNLKRLFHAFKKAVSCGLLVDLYLVIVGEKAWLYEDIMEACEDPLIKERIIFTGFLSDAQLGYVYRGAKFLIFPSLYEGFGLPPLEAMSFGLPVIASNRGSLPEILEDAPLWIDPESQEDMIEKMKMMLEDSELRMRCREKGMRLLDRYSWEKTARETIETYKKAMLS